MQNPELIIERNDYSYITKISYRPGKRTDSKKQAEFLEALSVIFGLEEEREIQPIKVDITSKKVK